MSGVTAAWIFQGNPRHYDLDRALQSLDAIWWRTPQHAPEIAIGDIAVIWRSGSEAGIIGIARVVAPPQLRGQDPDELEFLLHPDEDVSSTTRTQLAWGSVPFVPKDRVPGDPRARCPPNRDGSNGHRLRAVGNGVVRPLASPPTTATASGGCSAAELPLPLAWEQRAKGVMPMPGGYDGYLESTRQVCAIVADARPSSKELVQRMKISLGLQEAASRLRESFLRKMGLFRLDGGSLQLTDDCERWLATGDDRIVIALLHARVQFIGEMIAELRTPTSTEDLLAVVNTHYGLSWDSKTQLMNRRGWLQSGGMIAVDDNGMLVSTHVGRALLEDLTIRQRVDAAGAGGQVLTGSDTALIGLEGDGTATDLTTTDDIDHLPESALDALVHEIEVAATESSDPDRFERAVRDAFAFLGFDAEWLGGSGRTDVLLDAPLALGESYRVAVDAKTTGSGSLPDQQVDWTTLVEHRRRHEADYSLLVGPNPSPGRLMERARNHDIAVLSAA